MYKKPIIVFYPNGKQMNYYTLTNKARAFSHDIVDKSFVPIINNIVAGAKKTGEFIKINHLAKMYQK